MVISTRPDCSRSSPRILPHLRSPVRRTRYQLSGARWLLLRQAVREPERRCCSAAFHEKASRCQRPSVGIISLTCSSSPPRTGPQPRFHPHSSWTRSGSGACWGPTGKRRCHLLDGLARRSTSIVSGPRLLAQSSPPPAVGPGVLWGKDQLRSLRLLLAAILSNRRSPQLFRRSTRRRQRLSAEPGVA